MNIYIIGDLYLRVYTLGFDPKGESILFTICDDNKVIYSGLIDCYMDTSDKILTLFDELNIDSLNYLCITHPDSDHCVGVEKLKKYISNITKVVIPNGVFEYLDNYDDNVKKSLLYIQSLIKLNRNNKLKPIIYDACDNKTIIDGLYFVDTCGRKSELQIMTISPSTNVIEKYTIKRKNGIEIVENNDFSIINLIEFDNIKLLLASDSENTLINDSINNLTKFGLDFFSSKIDYIKIPHHTSKSSSLLYDVVRENGVNLSVTTIFRNHELPNLKLLEKYNNISDLCCCTGKKNNADKQSGSILYEINITNRYRIVKLTEDASMFKEYVREEEATN